MTFILETYHDAEGRSASVSQGKYCSAYIAEVYSPYRDGSGRAFLEYHNAFTTKANARRAIHRHGTGWKKEEAK